MSPHTQSQSRHYQSRPPVSNGPLVFSALWPWHCPLHLCLTETTQAHHQHSADTATACNRYSHMTQYNMHEKVYESICIPIASCVISRLKNCQQSFVCDFKVKTLSTDHTVMKASCNVIACILQGLCVPFTEPGFLPSRPDAPTLFLDLAGLGGARGGSLPFARTGAM